MAIADSVSLVYAQALLNASRVRDIVDGVREVLEELKEIWVQEPNMRKLLAHPGIEKNKKQKMISNFFPNLDNPLVSDFLGVLVEKERISEFPAIVNAYSDLVDVALGLARATVTSATALDQEMREKLVVALEKRFDSKIQLEEKVNADLIAGFTVRIGDSVIDSSARTQLVKIATSLSKVGVGSQVWEEE